MAKFKVNLEQNNFTVMTNYHLRDKNLSYKAKGLLSFMLSLPNDWDYSLKELVAISKESKDAIRSILNELKHHHYLKIEPSRNENGTFDYDPLPYIQKNIRGAKKRIFHRIRIFRIRLNRI